jgi:hypothetical protein
MEHYDIGKNETRTVSYNIDKEKSDFECNSRFDTAEKFINLDIDLSL